MAEFTFKVKGGREDFRRTSVILLNSGASHPKVADDGTVTVRADRGNPFAGIASQLRNESVKAFFKCDTVKVAGIRNRLEETVKDSVRYGITDDEEINKLIERLLHVQWTLAEIYFYE